MYKRQVFSRLFVSCQTRDGDLENFFQHENHSYPPSLSQFGDLRSGTKADIAACLEEFSESVADCPEVDVMVLDGAAIICMLKPTGSMTSKQYADSVFLPYLNSLLKDILRLRLDVVWDVYTDDSLKSSTREKRGKGIRRRVASTNTVPGNWQEFLRVPENKSELFQYLTTQAAENLSTKYLQAASIKTFWGCLLLHKKKQILECFCMWEMRSPKATRKS